MCIADNTPFIHLTLEREGGFLVNKHIIKSAVHSKEDIMRTTRRFWRQLLKQYVEEYNHV